MDQTYKGKVYIFIRERKHLEYTDEAGTPWCVCTNTGIININNKENNKQSEIVEMKIINVTSSLFAFLL